MSYTISFKVVYTVGYFATTDESMHKQHREVMCQGTIILLLVPGFAN